MSKRIAIVEDEAAIRENQFREDLYFRLNVVPLEIPPLRQRVEDIPFLAEHFIQRTNKEMEREVRGITPGVLERFEAYPWPGNVRELENRIRRAVIMAEGRKLTPEDLELSEGVGEGYRSVSLKAAREELERGLILRTLARHNGNVTRTAADLKISRPTLYDLMRHHNFKW